MSVSCPNPNHPDFIKLKEQLGEDEAYRQYMLNANEIPNPDLYENISSPEVNFSLKVTNALKSIADVRETIRLNTKESPYIETNLRKLLQGKGVYTEQIDFIFDYMKARNITEISTEQLAAELASEYSYTTKIDISKRNFERGEFNPETGEFGQTVENSLNNSDYYSNLTVPGGTNYTESEIATPDITPSIKGHAQFATEKGIGWFRSDDQELLKSIAPVQVTKEEYDAVLNNPTNVFGEFTEDGETYYTDENENRRYSRNKQGYFRQDVYQPNQAKTRRILEVQSDLFQKGRDRKDLLLSNNNRFKFTYNLSDFNIIYNFSNNSYKIVYSNNGNEPSLQYMPPKNIIEDVIKLEKDKIKASRNSSENQFLQLLNKSGNWVTFFIKSIIQDSAKKGYEKVLFPTGNTASKVEGHSTLEEFKKEKEERIKSRKEFLSELEKRNKTWVVVKGDKYEDKPVAYFDTEGETVKYIEDNDDLNLRYMSNNQVSINKEIEDINNEINQIKRELIKVETEGFAALRPIYNFYENTVTNILKKQGLNIKKIKDEYGNTWNEVNIKPQRDLNKILLRNVEEDDDIPLSDLQLYEHANKFFGKLKVPFQLMSEEELVLWNRANPDRAIGKDTKGFFDPSTNKVYLIKGRAGFYTTLHEFTHPLVEWVFRNNNPLFKTLVAKLKAEKGEQSFIDFLNQNGYTYLLQDGKMTDAAWKEVMTTEIEAASKSILNNAAVKPGSFLEAVKLFWKKIKEAISNLVSKDIGKLNDRQLLNLTINDLAVFMLDGDVKLDLHAPFSNSLSTVPNEAYGMLYYKNANTEFQTSVSRQTEEYKKRTGKDVTSNQLNVINTLLAYQGLVKGDDGYYDSVLDINYRRATEFLSTLKGPNGEENYFAYHGDENDEVGLKAAEWGNQVDELVQFILSGLDAQSAITQVIDNHNSRTVDNDTLAKAAISEEVLEELHETLKNYLGNKFKDYVVLTQVMLADSTTGVAGTADIVLISPDGKIKIVDIKTTKYSSEGTEYIKTYPLSSSKKQKHAGQLTIYKGIAKSMGLTIDESDDLAIIPVYFPDTNVEVIDEARLEPEVPIAAFEYILNMFETGDTEAMEETKSDDPEVNLIKQIKIILTKRLSDINKMPAGFKKSQAKIETETILDTLNQAESTKKLTEFVTGLHKQFTNQIKENKAGKKYTIYGLPSQIKYLTLELASGKITRDDALSKFLHIKNINDLYSPLLDDIRNIINSKDDTTVKSEMSNKLNEIQNGIAFIKKTYEEETVEIMADILVENVSAKANERAKTHLKTLKDRLDAATADKDKKKAQENYDSALRNLRSEEGITREVIIKALKEGSSKDIDWVDLWFTPAVTSSSELVAPFAMALKTKLEDARQELISFERQAGQAYERFGNFAGKGNPAEFNKGLYQTVEFFDKLDADGNPIYKQKQMFVSPVDLQKFHKVKGEFEKQLAAEEDPKKQNAIRSKFYSDNFVRKSEEDTVVINPITGERIVIEEGIKTLIEQKRQLYLKNIISEIDFNEFVKSTRGEIRNGVTTYNKQFLTINPVKFKNNDYAALESSGKKQYYDFLISSYFKSQSRLPHKMGYVLPSIHKSGADSVLEGGLINYIKYEGSQLLSFKAEEISKYGEEGKNIPLVFNFDMDAKDVSLDLIQSIVMYEAESLEYKAKSEVAESGEVLLSFVEKNAPYQTDTIGNKQLDSFAEKAGIKDEFLKYKKKLGGNNIAAMLTMYLDAQIYGKLNIKSGVTIFGKDLEKLVNGVMSFASITQVGGNPIGSAANYLQAAIQANIEAAAKDKMSDASWLQSRIIYDKHIVDYIKDFNSPYSKSFMGQLIDLYDPMQGEFKDAAGRRISKGAFKKLWSTNSWFFLQHIGEHSIQVRTMIGMMLDAKAIGKDGKYINLIDAYELDPKTNVIRLKDGVTLPGKLSANKLISREFQSSLHSLNKKLQGVYNKQDKINAERHTWGRLLTMYKKFLAPGLKRRYKGLGYDQELGDITEGYLRTFYNKIMTDASQLGRFMVGVDNGYYNEFEKQNLRRARREMLIVAATGAMVMLLAALIEGSGDDDDKRKLKYLLYLSMRINNELGIYGTFGDPQSAFMPNPSEIYKTIKNPIPAYGVTDRLNKLVKQMFHPFDEYKTKSGVWEKGDSKLWAAFLKFWGQNGTNADPTNSIKWMNMSTK